MIEAGAGRPWKFVIKQVATLSLIGFIPIAPGTMGTLAAALLVYAVRPGPLPLAAFTVFIIFLGTWSAGVAEERLGRDSRHIIIDEFAGYLLSVLFVPLSTGYLAAAFVLFRVLDITKPPPIRRLERLPGGVGVMADDLAAAAATNIILQLWRFLFFVHV
ncbi:MAG: phosphatidylglycerophosphatase A [Nitrospiraceae bacterium]|nr:phosphatidylglycerophosphatase A [Nitrospiraceae bacterium]